MRVIVSAAAYKDGMKSALKSIQISDKLIISCEGPYQVEKMDQLFRVVSFVPRSEILKQEAKWEQAQAKKKQAKQSDEPLVNRNVA
jgi:hypothetical protein